MGLAINVEHAHREFLAKGEAGITELGHLDAVNRKVSFIFSDLDKNWRELRSLRGGDASLTIQEHRDIDRLSSGQRLKWMSGKISSTTVREVLECSPSQGRGRAAESKVIENPRKLCIQGDSLAKTQAEKSVIVLTWDAGGGHRASAVALEQAFRQREHSYHVRIVSLKQVVEQTDPGWGAFRDNFYNSIVLRYGLFGLQRRAWPVQLRSRSRPGFKRRGARAFRNFFAEHKPAAVVSIVPFYNEIFCVGLKAVLPEVPYIVIPSDYGSPAYGFWFDASDSYYILGTARLMEEGRRFGIPEKRLLAAAGLMIHPKYTTPMSRKFSLDELGLTAGRKTGLVLYGVHPTRRFFKHILHVCDRTDLPIQLILVCGHDARLQASCERTWTRYPKVALGFVDNLHELMSASDFCVGKPGPGAITEAMASRLPFVVHTGKKPMVQEVPAADFVRTHGFGLHIDSLGELDTALEMLFVHGQHAEIRKRLNGYRNNGVYDAVDHVKAIVENSRTHAS